MKYQSYPIAKVLSRVNDDIFIPSIQRPYVWEPIQIIRLFDSLMRGYPINSFLFWKLRQENYGDWQIYRFINNFQQGSTHNETADIKKMDDVTLVLDGQQRLTSLLIGLQGSYLTRNGKRGLAAGFVENVLYLNLLESPDDNAVEDVSDDDKILNDVYYDFKFQSPRIRKLRTKDALWYRVSDIMKIRTQPDLDNLLDDLLVKYPDLTPEERRSLRSNLRRLYQVIWVDDIISYYLEEGQSYDKVLDIFIQGK